jgi:hypothetical protein
MMKKIVPALLVIIALYSFYIEKSFKGTWEYGGGVYNGKAEPAPKDYKLQREYTAKEYEARFLESGEKPVVYEKGNYKITQDTCHETQTYSSQPTKVLDITIKYRYQIKNDTLTFNGVLPNGTVVQEYWKKVK